MYQKYVFKNHDQKSVQKGTQYFYSPSEICFVHSFTSEMSAGRVKGADLTWVTFHQSSAVLLCHLYIHIVAAGILSQATVLFNDMLHCKRKRSYGQKRDTFWVQ